MKNRTTILAVFIGIAIIVSAVLILENENKTQKDTLPVSSANSDGNKQQEVVTVRYLATTGSIRLFELARELGYNKEFINITNIGSSTGGPESIQSIASDKADIASSAQVAIINAIAGGYKIKAIVGSGGYSPDRNGVIPSPSRWIVLENSSIKSAKDLVGKRIAVNTFGAASDYNTREYLARNGISKEQVELVAIPTPQFEMVLRQKQVDVLVTGGMTADKIQEGGGLRVLANESDFLGKQTTAVIFTSDNFLKEKPEAARKLVEAIAKAADWAQEHPKEANELAIKILKDRGEKPENAKYWNGFGVREHALIVDSDIEYWTDYLVKDGRIKEGQFKPSDIYTNEFNPYYKK